MKLILTIDDNTIPPRENEIAKEDNHIVIQLAHKEAVLYINLSEDQVLPEELYITGYVNNEFEPEESELEYLSIIYSNEFVDYYLDSLELINSTYIVNGYDSPREYIESLFKGDE